MAYVGVDLHTNRFTVYFKRAVDGGKTISYPITADGLGHFVAALEKSDHVFVEASGNTFAFSDVIKEHIRQVTVIDPFQFRTVVDSGKKTDKIDARKLAEMGKYHVETGGDFLPEVYIVDEKIRRLRSLFTTYNLMNKELNMVRNRIHSLFKEHLQPLSRTEIFSRLRHDVEAIPLAAEYKLQVKVLFEVLDCLEQKRNEIKHSILLLGEFFQADIDLLVSIGGVSVFIALALIADYATIERFRKAKQFSKYLRSTPRSEISNQTRRDGKTHKSGRKVSVKMLLQGLHHTMKENDGLDRFYGRLRKAKGACKARMAATRKLFVTIFFMLKKREYYYYIHHDLHARKMQQYLRFLKENSIPQ